MIRFVAFTICDNIIIEQYNHKNSLIIYNYYEAILG